MTHQNSLRDVSIAVVGATGVVGRELVSILVERGVAPDQVRLLASARSAGRVIPWGDASVEVSSLASDRLAGVDIVFLAASGAISRDIAPAVAASGSIVIDNSSAFRMHPDVPLVVPEVNGSVLDDVEPPGIIANPNCSTIIALVAVEPLHRAARVRRMVVSTYQAASGAGAAVMDELVQQTRDFVAGQSLTTDVTGRPYLFNVFSHDSAVGDDGANEEERKMTCEIRRIWDDQGIGVAATCVRVPVLRAHTESINLTFERSLSPEDARALLDNAAGVHVVDDPSGNRFPEPVHAEGRDDVLVGRIRSDHSQPLGEGLSLLVSGDQLRKGAALNAVQIAERVLENLAPAPCGPATGEDAQ